MIIKSKVNGQYSVHFSDDFTNDLKEDLSNNKCFFVIDKNVYNLYEKKLDFLKEEEMYFLDAKETNKTVTEAQKVIQFLLENKFKRNHRLIAIGGGITQDVACFVSSVLFRGIKWFLYPTTLLAQCDSCIGSKSSINVGEYKNQVGTFYPPEKIVIDSTFIYTLEYKDLLSGLGEAIKVHYLDPKQTYGYMIENYDTCLRNFGVLNNVIRRSLEIKKEIIEIDEYDRNYRNILNYGHTFGHALESATDYKIPHGVAVAVGIAIANYISLKLGYLPESEYDKMQPLLDKNISMHSQLVKNLNCDLYWSALQKDKKNIDGNIGVILTKGTGQTFKEQLQLNNNFKELILDYINKL